jgi:PTS system cellobiose-specific IIB component
MRIMLCCSAGMSTSLLVSKMKKSAREQGIVCEIWAVPVDTVIKRIDKSDILLVGPHVRYMFPQFKKLCDKKGISVDIINTVDYGTFNGEKVLQVAQQMFLAKQTQDD